MMTPFLAWMFSVCPLWVTGDAEHPPGMRILADDPRHPVLQQDLRAFLARAGGERPHDARAVAVAARRDHLGRVLPFDRQEALRGTVERLLGPDQPLDQLTPFSTNKSKVGTFSSANTRTSSRSL